MEHRLVQEQTLQRKMNQSLLQSIQLLQFSSVELLDHIKKIAEENPLIEEVDYTEDLATYRSSHTGDEHPEIGEINATQLSMYDTLKNQLYTLNISETLRPVMLFGIDSLNEDGYLDIELDEWSEACGVPLETVEEALANIQMLDPPGIGARTISECILLQLKETDVYEPFIDDLIETNLTWVANEDIEAMARAYDITEEKAKKVIDQIKLCHPKPGHVIADQTPEFIIPEARIFKENGQWKISFYKWNTPSISINPMYENMEGLEKDAAKYIKEKYKQVEWLQQALSYRTNTLEIVIRKIIEKQHMYFEAGPQKLAPLTLRQIANQLDLHISTISRTISNKYVQTEQGVIPLKFFFQPGITQADGKQLSAYAIKQLIAKMIANENKKKPLSDHAISKKLKEDYDIHVARRTVMKYRGQLNIPSSIKRK